MLASQRGALELTSHGLYENVGCRGDQASHLIATKTHTAGQVKPESVLQLLDPVLDLATYPVDGRIQVDINQAADQGLRKGSCHVYGSEEIHCGVPG